MTLLPCRRVGSSGFTLVEISIVLVIISLITASGLVVGTVMVSRAAYVDTTKQMEQINRSLRDYYVVNGRLPCVASLSSLPGTADFGVEIATPPGSSCAGGGAVAESPPAHRRVDNGSAEMVRIGMLPVRTLGLPDSAASDEYGNRIIYAVTENLTDAGQFGTEPGAITVQDMEDNAILTDAAYFIVSPGRDRKGALAYSTANEINPCDSSAAPPDEALDEVNCTFTTTIFRDAPYNSGSQEEYFFDDIARWAPKFHLMAQDTQSTSLWAGEDDKVWGIGVNDSLATYVGIGTDDPLQNFHVVGNTRIDGNVGINTAIAETDLHVTGSARIDTDTDYLMYFRNPAAPVNARHWTLEDVGSAGKLTFRVRNDNWTFKRTYLSMDETTGNLGFFTSSPTEKVHVNGNMMIGDRTRLRSDGNVQFGLGNNFTSVYGPPDTDQGLTIFGSTSNATGGSITLAGSTNAFWSGGRITYRAAMASSGLPAHHFYRISSAGAASALAEIQANGNMYIYGTTYSSASDQRLKKDIRPIENALDKVMAINGVYYRWNEKSGREDTESVHVGVLAQEVQAVVPEAVQENHGGFLALDRSSLVPVLIEAIKELKEENEALRAEIKHQNPGNAIMTAYDPLADYRLWVIAALIALSASVVTTLLLRNPR